MRSVTRPWRLTGLAIALAALAFGCDSSDNATGVSGDDPLSQTENINDPLGGFNASDEVAGFGDAYLLGDEGEVEVADPIAVDPAVASLVQDPTSQLVAVRLVWGYLRRPTDATTDLVDWSGSASVIAPAALIVDRTIHFEPIQGDHIVRPRPDRQTVEWVSTTTGGMDGLLMTLVVPADETTSLTVAMPLFNETYDLADLLRLNETTVVDADGHEVRISAREVEIASTCYQGWMSGRWTMIPPGEYTEGDPGNGVISGRFGGFWVNRNGTLGGAIHGFFGVNAAGDAVFFGKAIRRNGVFAGFVRGVWEESAGNVGTGMFQGEWLNRARDPIGALRGEWASRVGDEHGLFDGAWAIGCEIPDGGPEVSIDPSIFQ